MIRPRALIGALFAVLAAGTALGDDNCAVPQDFGLTANDLSRLAHLNTSRTRGLGAAMLGENARERAVVSDLYSPGVAVPLPELLPGKYQCRTIKLGGIGPLVVYSWFSCAIDKGPGESFAIKKTTGSQNFAGTLVPAGDGYAYKGTLFYGYESGPGAYGADAERDQVGCLSAVTKGNKHFLLELPFPVFESFHDVIELRPAD